MVRSSVKRHLNLMFQALLKFLLGRHLHFVEPVSLCSLLCLIVFSLNQIFHFLIYHNALNHVWRVIIRSLIGISLFLQVFHLFYISIKFLFEHKPLLKLCLWITESRVLVSNWWLDNLNLRFELCRQNTTLQFTQFLIAILLSALDLGKIIDNLIARLSHILLSFA